jgi:hypothetical protein
MATPITVFSGSTGLNTKLDPTRVRFDRQAGISDLAVAYNVDHDASGRISRRKGYSATAALTAAHSLWAAAEVGPCFFVTGTSLCELHTDYSYTAVATVTAGATVRYLQLADKTLWLNGFEKGLIQHGTAQGWTAGAYYGPTTRRTLSDPPIGHLVAHHRGRVWIGQGAVAWYSEPFSTNQFDLTRNFVPFVSRLRLIVSCGRTLFVSDETSTWALVGATPNDAELVQVADYPAIEGTEAVLDLSRLGAGELTGIGAIWTSAQGICVGLPEGQLLNLTQKKLDLPTAAAGAGAVVGDRYVGLLQP